jgi:hypothetical protein
VRERTPIATLALDRLGGVEDYADFSRNFAGIGKASAQLLSDGHRQLVHVTVAGTGNIAIAPSDPLARNLLAALVANGDSAMPVAIAARRLRLLVMRAAIGIDADRAWEDVSPVLRATLLAAFSFRARALGQPAFASEALAIMHAVPGVQFANLTTFDSVGEDLTAATLANLAATLRARPAVAVDLARINPVAARGAADRILPAELAILTPDIPDTLLLTQASS